MNKDLIQNTLEVVETFAERFLPYAKDKYVTHISTVDAQKVRFTINNEYYLFAWLENREMHVESEYGDNVLESCREDNWTDEIINYMRFGTQII